MYEQVTQSLSSWFGLYKRDRGSIIHARPPSDEIRRFVGR